MADFLTTAGTAHQLEQIVSRARERLILVSPYLQLSPILLQRLKDAAGRGVPIKIVYGKDELKEQERAHLGRISTLELLRRQFRA